MSDQVNTAADVDAVDWKAIAMALGQRVNWAVVNIDAANGSGLVLNMSTGESRHWKIYMAEALRMIPGVTIDEEILAANCLTGAERRKRLKEISKRAAKNAEAK